MYNSFFEIDYPPFSISQDLKYLYLNKKLIEILDGLKYACNTKEGIIKLTGDVGSGKTIICKALANELKENFLVVNIHSAEIKDQNVLEFIDFKLMENNVDSFLPKNNMEVPKNIIKNRILLIFDDYTKISYENLNRIIYANENVKSTSLVTFLLISNNYENNKTTDLLEKINDRVTYHFDMPKLSKDDTINYINYRLKVAGYKNNQIGLFSKKICSFIYEKSNGLPRKINILCDKCLISAFLNQRKYPSKKDFLSALESSYIDSKNKSLVFRSYNFFFFITISFAILITIIFSLNNFFKPENDTSTHVITKNENKQLKDNQVEALNIYSLNEMISASLSEINNTDNSFSTILISIHYDPQKIISFINEYNYFFKKKLLIYKTTIGNENGYCIIYGKFDNLFSAKETISKLPKKILNNKPYVRTFGGIKKELKGTID